MELKKISKEKIYSKPKGVGRTLKNCLVSTKSQEGITLTALVVTIIVLLILAGVSINMVFSDSGIIKKAQAAQEKVNVAGDNDLEGINYLNEKIEDYVTGNQTSDVETTPDTPTIDDPEPDTRPLITDLSLKSNNRITTTSETVIAKDEKGNQVVVPGRFKISDASGNSVQQGVVIEDSAGNQFVWVPVSNIDGSTTNPIILDNGTEKVITLGRYTFNEKNGTEILVQKGSEYAATTYANVKNETEGTNNYKIESSSYDYYELSDEGRNGVESNGSNGENATAKDLEAFITKTGQNKGYYIARYEASYGSGYNASGADTAAKFANAKPLSRPSIAKNEDSMNYETRTLWNRITQPQASKVCKNMYSGNSYVESDLINSYAWDTAIVYIQAMGNSNYANQPDGNGTLKNTGSTGDEKCKIFDMLGNELEWTTEYCTRTTSYAFPCTTRGGNYYDSYNYVVNRGYSRAANSSFNISFRPILYVINNTTGSGISN